MSKFQFSKASNAKLNTCHPELQIIMREAIKVSPIDFGIAEGYRSEVRQRYLFSIGRSKIDGINRLSKHNHKPSMAVDIFPWTPDKNGDWGISYNQPEKKKEHLYAEFALLTGVILSTHARLLNEGLVSHALVNGANWDGDELFVLDHTFIDWPHFELR